MLKDDLKCVLIGRDIKIYHDLAKLVRKIDTTSRFKQVDLTQAAITATLKKISGPSLIFISDEVPFSLELLSDLTWQYHADAIVVIISTKARTVSIKEPFNNAQFARVNLDKKNPESSSILQFLIQSAREKSEFRRCKNLLGVSEKRCQWLVDSSREAVAFISRDMHWYANLAYLDLFGISSVQKLRSVTVKDLIIADEHLLFDGFQQSQSKSTDSKRSIMLSMKKLNGSTFRANTYLIPSVFKGHKCYQLWVRKINPISTADNNTSKQTDTYLSNSNTLESSASKDKGVGLEDVNPFSGLLNKNTDQSHSNTKRNDVNKAQAEKLKASQSNSTKVSKQKSYDQSSLLKGVIRRKEARIVVEPLNYLKDNESHNKNNMKLQMLSLKVATAQKKGVDDLLVNLPESFNDQMRTVFWDKVKFSRMLQILIKRKRLSVNLLLRVNEASIIDEAFIDWLIPGLKRLGDKSKNLTFLIPSNINESEHKKTLSFIRKLRKFKCKIVLDSFSINREALILLKYSKPDYVRLSLPWTRQLQGNEAKEIRLSSAIRQLEGKNIKVIAPCGFSKDMRRLFILSGASFCQERL